MDTIEGFILVGGESSRMGTDKSRLLLHGHTFVEELASILSPAVRSVIVVGRNAEDLGLKSAMDVLKEWGALGGIHAALTVCKSEWAFVLACDLPFVTQALLQRITSLRSGFEAVVPRQPNGYAQPLCALYRVDPCLARCETLIQNGERRPRALLKAVETRMIEFEELSDLDGADRFFDNINTPEDYARAMKGGGSGQKMS